MARMLVAVLWLLFFVAGLAAGEWSGTVVAIADGDTLSVMRDGAPVKIRLWGIDCPEARQPFGAVARRFLGERAHGRTVTVHERDRDRYGRVVAIVEVDGVDLNRELVAAGVAWVYVRYCRKPERADWSALEAEAKSARLGLWSHPDPVPPWDWRQQRRAVRVQPAPLPPALRLLSPPWTKSPPCLHPISAIAAAGFSIVHRVPNTNNPRRRAPSPTRTPPNRKDTGHVPIANPWRGLRPWRSPPVEMSFPESATRSPPKMKDLYERTHPG